jgi:hypothetical protein
MVDQMSRDAYSTATFSEGLSQCRGDASAKQPVLKTMGERFKRIGISIAAKDNDPTKPHTPVSEHPFNDSPGPSEAPEVAIGKNQRRLRAKGTQAEDRLRDPRHKIHPFFQAGLTNKFKVYGFKPKILNVDT